MKKYKVIEKPIQIHGEVGLDAEQVKRRSGRVESLGNGVYRTKEPQDFKAGEIIGLHEVAKHLLPFLEAVDGGAPAQQPLDEDVVVKPTMPPPSPKQHKKRGRKRIVR